MLNMTTRVEDVADVLRGAIAAAVTGACLAVYTTLGAALVELDRSRDVDVISGMLIAACAPCYGTDAAGVAMLGAVARAVEDAAEIQGWTLDVAPVVAIAHEPVVVFEPAPVAAPAPVVEAPVYELPVKASVTRAPAPVYTLPAKRVASTTPSGKRRGRMSTADRLLAGKPIKHTYVEW